MRRTIAILLGLPVSFIFLAITAGGIESAFQILSLSIVCTAGISLLLWIPLWWFVGWLLIKIYESITGRIVGENATSEGMFALSNQQPNQQRIALNSDQISLVNYIEKATRQGLSETQIYSRLRAQGWGDEEIQQAQLFSEK
ncbi:MAG: hypothetical protein HC908_08160 [Calothrix sp. SM1_7_51]|nr:hypothetical protein [Calothrix sp. SM1_7_51]